MLEQIKIVFQRVKLLLTCNQISLALQPFGALRLQYSLSDTKSASKHTAARRNGRTPLRSTQLFISSCSAWSSASFAAKQRLASASTCRVNSLHDARQSKAKRRRYIVLYVRYKVSLLSQDALNNIMLLRDPVLQLLTFSVLHNTIPAPMQRPPSRPSLRWTTQQTCTQTVWHQSTHMPCHGQPRMSHKPHARAMHIQRSLPRPS